ncbi:DNA-3-methyladenine glycosylase [Streptacidiphilus sp. EB129]|uniref:DNA-3-methyladenine glycosylase n=1 Tax=Streptacidiphilus sp. EB129 TaxID=3156262 RepID=UPI0035151338
MLLAREFFARPAHQVAPDLLGHVLVRQEPEQTIACRITEVEAYEGATDPASHGYRGPTGRNAVMFGPAGYLYVYWIYGMHHAANIVCGPEGQSHAVLLRAGEIIEGRPHATLRRPTARNHDELAKGPGRLTLALGIDRTLNGVDLCSAGSPVQATVGKPDPDADVRSGPRTGISKAMDTPWRFWLGGDPTVSPYRRLKQSTRSNRVRSDKLSGPASNRT